MACIERGSLYESAPHHACVFTGKDELGKTRFAAIRGPTSSFKQDAPGSSKSYGFCLPPSVQGSNESAIFESAIDCLSHQTLCKRGFIPDFGGWRLSLSGGSLLALERFLKTHPEVNHCLVSTDNDRTGETIAAKIRALPGISAVRSPPPCGKDWNDALDAALTAESVKNRCQQSACL
jgi:hypothetical protein